MAAKKAKPQTPVQPVDKHPPNSLTTRRQSVMNELAQVAVDLQRINRTITNDKPLLEKRFNELDAELHSINNELGISD